MHECECVSLCVREYECVRVCMHVCACECEHARSSECACVSVRTCECVSVRVSVSACVRVWAESPAASGGRPGAGLLPGGCVSSDLVTRVFLCNRHPHLPQTRRKRQAVQVVLWEEISSRPRDLRRTPRRPARSPRPRRMCGGRGRGASVERLEQRLHLGVPAHSLRRPQGSGEPRRTPGVCWEAGWPAGAVPNRTALRPGARTPGLCRLASPWNPLRTRLLPNLTALFFGRGEGPGVAHRRCCPVLAPPAADGAQ